MIEIIKSGLLTTVQDGGRPSFQRYGVSVSGAMDRLHVVANLLGGNRARAASLEVTLGGPAIKIHTDDVFAIAGGDFLPKLDGVPIENNRAYAAKKGSILELGNAVRGSRAYVSFAGRIDCDVVMGSKSTYTKGKFGGWKGRTLKAGDQIPLMNPKAEIKNLPFRFVNPSVSDRILNENVVRVIEGPQVELFSQKGLDAFFSGEYEVCAENDRMGYRLSGPKIEHIEGSDGNIITDGVPLGAIQVPADQPIVMMADRQTTGGYTKIASVISVDLPIVAQKKGGDKIRFKKVTIDEAQQLFVRRAQFYLDLAKELDEANIISRKIMRANVAGHEYNMTVSEIV